MGQVINLIGQRFGRLTVIERVENNKENRACWLCQCDCGNQIVYPGSTLRRGRAQSCGCLKLEDLTGKKFGKLTVIKYTFSKNGQRYWHCVCECGNSLDVSTKNLKSGNTKSCGCLHREKTCKNNIDSKSVIDPYSLIGKQFDFLEVLDYVGVKNGRSSYICKCHHCGNVKIISKTDLIGNRVHACGCLLSWKEETLKNLFNKYQINYSSQYSFSDLRSEKNILLRFDFAVFSQQKLYCLIEYNGIQHYDSNNLYWTPELQKHDSMKKEYCNKNNILLYILDKNTDLELFVKTLQMEVM